MYYLIKCESFTGSSWQIVSDEDPEIKKFFEEYYKSNSIEAKLGYLEVGGIKRLVKKSENIYDLIEEGDLIQWGEANNIIKIDFNDSINILDLLKTDNAITAIYKPNEKGDYIKVWEHENNV